MNFGQEWFLDFSLSFESDVFEVISDCPVGDILPFALEASVNVGYCPRCPAQGLPLHHFFLWTRKNGSAAG